MPLAVAALVVAAACLLAGCAGNASRLWHRLTLVAPGERARNFRDMDAVLPSRPVPAAAVPAPLASSPRALATAGGDAGDPFVDDAFVAHTRTTGLLVLDGDTIVLERYRLGASADARFTSWSMAKSVVSTLVGVALAEGRLRSLDDPVTAYAPSLRDTGYDGVAIRDVLQMASGVRFDERYDHALSDIRKLFYKLFFGGVPVGRALATAERASEPGLEVRYASLDTQALAAVLVAVNGEPLAATLARTIWGPAGMADDATWSLDAAAEDGGEELAFCCLNATLRDWARFGRYVRDAGTKEAQGAPLPPGWVDEASSAARPLGAPGTVPGTRFGYGYQWWIPPDADGELIAIGVYGQYLYVNRSADVVIVKTAADPDYRMDDEAHVAFFRAIVGHLRALGGTRHAALPAFRSRPAPP